MSSEILRIREQIVHEHLGLEALDGPVRFALALHEAAVEELAPATPEGPVRSHEAAQASRQELAAHDEARAGRVNGAALLEQVPGGLGGTQDHGGRGAYLEVDDIAKLLVQLSKP